MNSGKPEENALDTRKFVLRDGAVDEVPQVYASFWGVDTKPIIIADANTWPIAGEQLKQGFRVHRGETVDSYIFPSESEVYADYRTVLSVRALLLDNKRIAIALGSGTINDVVKRASFECGKQYLVVPTAPSVDGYTSAGAAISVDGFKQTLACPAPLVVVADSDILRSAPYPMIAAGYCDLLAKVPAGADWILADALGMQPIVPEVWSLVQTDLREQIGHPDRIALRDRGAIDNLTAGLVATGFAMQRMRDSRPASGADHLFSHAWEMSQSARGMHSVSHGFKVAIGSLISTAMMTEVLKLDRATLLQKFERHPGIAWSAREAQVRAFWEGLTHQETVLNVCREKFLEGEQLVERRAAIAKVWERVRDRIRGQILPFARLKDMLQTANCPTEPRDIGLSRTMMRDGIYMAQMIRTRYTILDYLYEIGIFDEIAELLLDGSTYFREYL